MGHVHQQAFDSWPAIGNHEQFAALAVQEACPDFPALRLKSVSVLGSSLRRPIYGPSPPISPPSRKTGQAVRRWPTPATPTARPSARQNTSARWWASSTAWKPWWPAALLSWAPTYRSTCTSPSATSSAMPSGPTPSPSPATAPPCAHTSTRATWPIGSSPCLCRAALVRPTTWAPMR